MLGIAKSMTYVDNISTRFKLLIIISGDIGRFCRRKIKIRPLLDNALELWGFAELHSDLSVELI